jgi:cytochrome b561
MVFVCLHSSIGLTIMLKFSDRHSLLVKSPPNLSVPQQATLEQMNRNIGDQMLIGIIYTLICGIFVIHYSAPYPISFTEFQFTRTTRNKKKRILQRLGWIETKRMPFIWSESVASLDRSGR